MSAEQRVLRARLAAHVMHSQHDTTETTAAAHAASHVTRYEKLIDPDHVLSEQERARRVESARKAHMTKLALASSRKRAEGKQAKR